MPRLTTNARFPAFYLGRQEKVRPSPLQIYYQRNMLLGLCAGLDRASSGHVYIGALMNTLISHISKGVV